MTERTKELENLMERVAALFRITANLHKDVEEALGIPNFVVEPKEYVQYPVMIRFGLDEETVQVMVCTSCGYPVGVKKDKGNAQRKHCPKCNKFRFGGSTDTVKWITTMEGSAMNRMGGFVEEYTEDSSQVIMYKKHFDMIQKTTEEHESLLRELETFLIGMGEMKCHDAEDMQLALSCRQEAEKITEHLRV